MNDSGKGTVVEMTLLKSLSSYYEHLKKSHGEHSEYAGGYRMCMSLVERRLSGTPKNSRWRIHPDGFYPFCPDCYHEPENGVMSNFCPFCGADMRNEGSGNEL